jgi:hypothetical protein
MAGHTKWMVSELVDPREPALSRYVIAHRQGERPWLRVWRHRDKLRTKLAAWMRSLADIEPLAKPLLGRQVALNETTAQALCKFRLAEINRMSGCPDGWADFLLNERPVNCGRRGRPVTIIEGDQVKTYRSVTEAAKAEGLARSIVAKRVLQGREYKNGQIVA